MAFQSSHLRSSAKSAVSAARAPETHAIIGAAMEVQGQWGHGFLEAVYQEALEREFVLRSIPANESIRCRSTTNGFSSALHTALISSAICTVLVEIKALTSVEDAQVLHYLKATGLERELRRFAASQSS